MRYSREDPGFSRVATLDIETTHYKPAQGETVSIGLSVHDRGTPGNQATYHTLHRNGDGEANLIQRAISELDDLDADGLVSYKGRGFDLQFLSSRMQLLGKSPAEPKLDTRESHIDLFEDRKREADRLNKKWPSLEECLQSYELKPATTTWGGSELTNVRFGEELGPAYLRSLDADDKDRSAALTEIIEHYLVTDLEANIAIYYGDIGEAFEPAYLGSNEVFEA